MNAPWNSRTVKQSMTARLCWMWGTRPPRCHWKLNCQVCWYCSIAVCTPTQCRYGFLVQIGNNTYIWTWMVSNNTTARSHDLRRTYGIRILTYFRRFCCITDSCQHASMFMSIFLFKSDGSTPQSIHFNVFVIVVFSIHCENNIWIVKSSVFWNSVPESTETHVQQSRMRSDLQSDI